MKRAKFYILADICNLSREQKYFISFDRDWDVDRPGEAIHQLIHAKFSPFLHTRVETGVKLGGFATISAASRGSDGGTWPVKAIQTMQLQSPQAVTQCGMELRHLADVT